MTVNSKHPRWLATGFCWQAGPKRVNCITSFDEQRPIGNKALKRQMTLKMVVLGGLIAISGCESGRSVPTIGTQGHALLTVGAKRYLVKYRDHAGAQAALTAAGGQIHRALGPQSAFAATIPQAAVNGLSHHPSIAYLEEDAMRYPMAETTPYGIAMVQANLVAQPAIADNPIKVCIIDSGALVRDSRHEDFQASNITGVSVVAGEDWDRPLDAHGTHVAGTIAAIGGNDKGVVGVLAKGVSLHIVKVFSDDGSGAPTSVILEGFNECVKAGAQVVNMSLGGSVRSKTAESTYQDAYSNGGMLIFAAAGNDGSSRRSYPASYSSVISVAAVDQNENVASFSQHNSAVEIAAPGVSVLSTVPYADNSSLFVNGKTYPATHIQNAGQGNISGDLVAGGLCDAASAPSNPGPWTGKVVVCQRGDYSFAEKVLAVQGAGGLAAVIYNNVDGPFSGFMDVQTTPPIPAIGLSKADGEEIVAQLLGMQGDLHTVVSNYSSGYALFDGTSMATPHAAGVAALVWSQSPASTNQQVRDALNQSAKDRGAAGRDAYTGYGLIQARAALCALTGQGCAAACAVDSDCDDGDACNGVESCITGECSPGTALSCDDGKACTADSCDPQSGCVNALVAAGTVCRAASGLCDAAESCNGVDETCPADGVLAAGTSCRADSGDCDLADSCDGSSKLCADLFDPSGTSCDGGAGTCDSAGRCSSAQSTTMHVASFVGSSQSGGKSWTASVTTQVHAGDHLNAGAGILIGLVSGQWTGQCVTDASGSCTIAASGIAKKVAGVIFTIDTLTDSTGALTYLAGDNEVTEITVWR